MCNFSSKQFTSQQLQGKKGDRTCWQGLALTTRGAIRDKQCTLSTASFNKNRLNGTNSGLARYKETRRGVLENRLRQCNRETV